MVKRIILKNKVLDEEGLKEIEKVVRKEIDEAAEECRKAPRPDDD